MGQNFFIEVPQNPAPVLAGSSFSVSSAILMMMILSSSLVPLGMADFPNRLGCPLPARPGGRVPHPLPHRSQSLVDDLLVLTFRRTLSCFFVTHCLSSSHSPFLHMFSYDCLSLRCIYHGLYLKRTRTFLLLIDLLSPDEYIQYAIILYSEAPYLVYLLELTFMQRTSAPSLGLPPTGFVVTLVFWTFIILIGVFWSQFYTLIPALVGLRRGLRPPGWRWHSTWGIATNKINHST
jgi:hypothetical protein